MDNKIIFITDIERAGIIRTLLRGAGQVMFQDNTWCGLLFLAGIFWGAYIGSEPVVAWGALAGLVISTVTGYILSEPEEDGSQGLWGFNGILVGCAMPTFLGNTLSMWFVLVVAAAMTIWVRRALNNVLSQWKINSLTFPFVLTTWIFLLSARAMGALPDTHMSVPELPTLAVSTTDITFWDVIAAWLKGVAQVFLINSWVTGALLLVGLFIADRWAALWAATGSALALLLALLFRTSTADAVQGLYGFSPTLTAIALATVFYRPNFRSALWALMGIVATLFLQAAMNILVEPYGIATLTAPFCIITWLFLLPQFKLDEREPVDHSSWHKKSHKPLK